MCVLTLVVVHREHCWFSSFWAGCLGLRSGCSVKSENCMTFGESVWQHTCLQLLRLHWSASRDGWRCPPGWKWVPVAKGAWKERVEEHWTSWRALDELKSTGRVEEHWTSWRALDELFSLMRSLCLPVALLIVSEHTGGVVGHTRASSLGHCSAQRGTPD